MADDGMTEEARTATRQAAAIARGETKLTNSEGKEVTWEQRKALLQKSITGPAAARGQTKLTGEGICSPEQFQDIPPENVVRGQPKSQQGKPITTLLRPCEVELTGPDGRVRLRLKHRGYHLTLPGGLDTDTQQIILTPQQLADLTRFVQGGGFSKPPGMETQDGTGSKDD